MVWRCATTCCVRSGWPLPPRSMSNSSRRTRWRATLRSYTGRQTVTSRPAERSTESARAPMINRSTRSNCSRTTAITLFLTWRCRQTDRPGRRSARSHSRLKPRPDSRSCPMGHVASRKSIGWASATTVSAHLIGARADVDFYRIEPPSGDTKGLPAAKRTDVGEGDIPPEVRGRNFFPYKPFHLEAAPPRPNLANIVNAVQRVLSSGTYQGAIWTQGSPRIEEALYWFNLLLDTSVPLCGNSAQRAHGTISNDGPRNIVDSVDWIVSRAWADDAGQNCAGVVLVSDQRVFATREVAKVDARPGGYVAVGGHGGILGSAGGEDVPILLHIPAMKHTYRSEVNIARLPAEVMGVLATQRGPERVKVAVKSAAGELLESAIPRVAIIKDGSYFQEDWEPVEENEVDLIAM